MTRGKARGAAIISWRPIQCGLATGPRTTSRTMARGMARPKVPGRSQPPRKRARGIVINEGVTPFRTTQAIHPPIGGKGKSKGPIERTPSEESSDSMGIYATHLTTSESEDNSGDRSPASASEPKDNQTLKTRRAVLHSKSLHDPARIPVPPMPPLPPAQTAEQVPLVPPVQAPPPRSLNRLIAVELRTILEEKRLSIDGIVDMYPAVWNTIKFHKFEMFTNPRGSYIPSWVWKF
ncbi:hypothetical protein MTR67_012329 [Solanum verrucosum]|uniref:Uncharacterized protein n=1 Tax=Solanum verrucosum TaxID=315347 RepID=A0AAF0Q8D7_SOLVR|nr:hypothetical protein MTR67_012329 [Solanum verrucosum]